MYICVCMYVCLGLQYNLQEFMENIVEVCTIYSMKLTSAIMNLDREGRIAMIYLHAKEHICMCTYIYFQVYETAIVIIFVKVYAISIDA